MQTQCPQCKTRFRITDAQLDAAEGHVRCSICDEVFNARSNDDIADDITSDNAADSASDNSLDNNEIKESADNLSKDNLDEIDEDISLSEMNKLDIAKADDEQPDNKNFDNADQLEAESQPKEPTEPDSETQPETQSTSSNQVVESDVEDDTVDAADISTGNETETSDDQEQLFDLFDEDADDSESRLIPDEFRNELAANESSIGTKILSASGILLLTITLGLEYLWFNRDNFVESPEAQKFIEKTCLQLDCSKLTIRNPSNIELLTRNVYSHPNEKNALMINIALQNNAKFAQPYPILQISFSDVRGNTIAARRFTPAEYFKTTQDKLPLLHSNAESSINLEIEDPGKQAITYEFNFL